MFMLGGFASGLLVYWIANNMITFAQQYIIMKRHGYTSRPVREHPFDLPAQEARREVSWRLTQIWRHPIKGIGAERLDHVGLKVDRPLPMDPRLGRSGGRRRGRRRLGAPAGTSSAAPRARLSWPSRRAWTGDTIHLAHPDRPDIAIEPGTEGAAGALPRVAQANLSRRTVAPPPRLSGRPTWG